MSHRIIIRSSNVSKPSELAALHDSGGGEREITVSFEPSHNEPDRVVLDRVGRVMKLMRKMEEAISGDPATLKSAED